MKTLKKISFAVAFAAALVPALSQQTTAHANATHTVISTSSMPDTAYTRKSATGWTYNLTGSTHNLKFGHKTHYLKNYPNTTWHATKKRYILKKSGAKSLYYYVTNGRKTASGWIWHGYLQKKSYGHTANNSVTTDTTSTDTASTGTTSTGTASTDTSSTTDNSTANTTTDTTSDLATSGFSAINRVAQSQLGKPYIYGANGPSAFDCSSFTKYVYRRALGVNLPRVAQAQYNAYPHVSAKNAKPGDLIFFGTSKYNITHVGIYKGNNKMIDAQLRGVINEKTNVSWWHTVGYARPATLS